MRDESAAQVKVTVKDIYPERVMVTVTATALASVRGCQMRSSST